MLRTLASSALIVTSAASYSQAATLPYTEDFEDSQAQGFVETASTQWSVVNDAELGNAYDQSVDDGNGGNTTATSFSVLEFDDLSQGVVLSATLDIDSRGGSGPNRDVQSGLFALTDASGNNGYALLLDIFGPTNGNAYIYEIDGSGNLTELNESAAAVGIAQNNTVYNFTATIVPDGSSLMLDLVVDEFDTDTNSVVSTATASAIDASPATGSYLGLGSDLVDAKTNVQFDDFNAVVPEPGSALLISTGLALIMARRRLA